MAQKTFKFTLTGTVGPAPEIRFMQIPEATILSGVISNITNQDKGFPCSWSVEAAGKDALILKLFFCGTEGAAYRTRVDVLAVYESNALRAAGEERVLDTREITFAMQAKGDEIFALDVLQEIDAEVVACTVREVRGNDGSSFSVEAVGDRGVRCFGGFVHDAGAGSPLEAEVVAVLGVA